MIKKPSVASGPKTARGKARSSRNAQKHGLLSSHLINAGEVRAQFDLLLATLQDELRPVGLTGKRACRAHCRNALATAPPGEGRIEKTGPIVSELRIYLDADTKISGISKALGSGTDDNVWTALLDEVAGFDPNQPNALEVFAKTWPHAYSSLSDDAALINYRVEDFLMVSRGPLHGSWIGGKRFCIRNERLNRRWRYFGNHGPCPKPRHPGALSVGAR